MHLAPQFLFAASASDDFWHHTFYLYVDDVTRYLEKHAHSDYYYFTTGFDVLAMGSLGVSSFRSVGRSNGDWINLTQN